MVYLRPSTVSINVTSTVLDVLAVLDVVVGVGAGAAAPETPTPNYDRAHVGDGKTKYSDHGRR